MEACLAVEKEIDKVLSKFNGINENTVKALSEIIQEIESVKEDLVKVPDDKFLEEEQKNVLRTALKKVRELVVRLTTEHREVHGSVSKVGKVIDRYFVLDYAAVARDDVFDTPDQIDLINEVICQHYYRLGMHDVVDALYMDADMRTECGDQEPFNDLNYILDCLKKKDSEPAIAWCIAHRSFLESRKSNLEFDLHKLNFVEIIRKGPAHQREAIHYARAHFRKFVPRHQQAVQSMMGMLLYLSNGIDSSPYRSMLDEGRWIEVCDQFMREACQMLGFSIHSPLATAVNAGCTSLPALLSIKEILAQRHLTSGIWSGKEELPIELDLDKDSKFHSMFACPILRQQSTQGNPPMRLICGHVISKEALTKLASGNKVKCPYCPIEQSPSVARRVYF